MRSVARIAIILLAIVAFTLPASAGSKELEMLIKLQTQMQTMQDQMARMQQSYDERMGVMKNLVEQTADSVNRMNASLAALDKSVKTQNGDTKDTTSQLSNQIQAMHDSVDELKARLNKAMKQLDDIQSTQQSMQAALASAPKQPDTPQAPPPDVLYDGALRDYTGGKYDLATGEFQDYLKYYAKGDKAGNAQFYLADILYKQGDFEHAVPEYDKVLEQYPDGNKVAAAQLKKGFALIELNQKPNGIKELRSLIARFPNSEEADLARERLKKIGALPTGAPRRK